MHSQGVAVHNVNALLVQFFNSVGIESVGRYFEPLRLRVAAGDDTVNFLQELFIFQLL